MYNKIILFLIAVCGILALNSCSSLKKGLGIEKEIPNEFLIEKRDPWFYRLITKCYLQAAKKKLKKQNNQKIH